MSIAEKPNTSPGPRRSSGTWSRRSRSFQTSTWPSITTNISMLGSMKASRISSPASNRSTRAAAAMVATAAGSSEANGSCCSRNSSSERGNGNPQVTCFLELSRRRWLGDLVAGRPDGRFQRLLPRSVVDVLLQRGVHLLDHRGVALLDADAVHLVGESLADRPSACPGTRSSAANPARITSSVVTASTWLASSASTQSENFGTPSSSICPWYFSLTFAAEVVPGTEHSIRPFKVSGPVISVFVAADQQILVGLEVGAGEIDHLLALVGDRVGRDDQVDLAAGQQVLAGRPGRPRSR